MDQLTDEIESILFIAREVMGEYRPFRPCRATPTFEQPTLRLAAFTDSSVSGPTKNSCIRI